MGSLDLEQLVRQLTAPERPHARMLVGVDGPGASGKSTLAELIRERLTGAVVVHVDDFFLPSAVRDSRAGLTGELFDLPRLEREVLVPVSTGAGCAYRRYDWDSDTLAEDLAVPAGVPVIVEGVYSLSRRLRAYYSYKIYCRASHDLRLERGVERDGEAMRAVWTDEWMPQETRYEASEDPVAGTDLVVDSSRPGSGSDVFDVVYAGS